MKREDFEAAFKKASGELSPTFMDEVIKSNVEIGVEERLVICMEECAELAQAASKMFRGRGDKLNLIEEMGDVIVCIEALKHAFFIADEDINKAINVKLERGI